MAAAGYTVETALPCAGAFVSADREALGRADLESPRQRGQVLAVAQDGLADDGRASTAAWRFSVRDRGVGVPPEDRRRIFDKFARGANATASGAKGTGLGLAMVRHIVGAHGGTVHVESTPGEGSIFTIVLPLIRPVAAER